MDDITIYKDSRFSFKKHFSGEGIKSYTISKDNVDCIWILEDELKILALEFVKEVLK